MSLPCNLTVILNKHICSNVLLMTTDVHVQVRVG